MPKGKGTYGSKRGRPRKTARKTATQKAKKMRAVKKPKAKAKKKDVFKNRPWASPLNLYK